MKITSIKTFHVDTCLLVRVYTDAGIVGTGESGLWAHQDMVRQAIEELSEYYVGKDAGRIEHHYQVVSRNTHFMGSVLSAAMSAIDVALWDILGKSLDKPVHQLLGGKVRDRVKVFGNVQGRTYDERAKQARDYVDQGYVSLRTIPYFPGFEQKPASQVVAEAVGIVKAIREAIGYEIDLGIEVHRSLARNEVVVLGNELAPYRILYLEDPLMPESTDSLRYVAAHMNIPLAAGERSYNLYQFKEIIDTGAVSLVRPDISLVGGFTQAKKIAGLAESALVGIFPHLMGSPINISSYTQFAASVPNFVLMESWLPADEFNEILENPPKREGGYIVVPDRPGIGVELREDKLAKFPRRPRPVSGHFREDGSVAH
ncbi:MAG: mandelate racemase/muconate lactonizing enzyme family protein [Chloroflexota bacterium]